MAGPRPIGVTIIGVLMVIYGIIGVITAFITLFNMQDNVGLVSAIVIGVVSVIYLAVARGILRGSRGARLIIAIVTVISLIVGILTLIFSADLRLTGLVQAAFAAVILLILYSKRAQAFFA
jgi:O-antigen/teichoic acid export membrane protein